MEFGLTWQLVASGELAGDISVLVLLLLVLSLHDDELVGHLDGDLGWRELLHIQNDLELLAVDVEGGTGLLLLQAVRVPGAQVSRSQHCGAGVPHGGHEVIPLQSLTEVLVQEARGAHWKFELIPPVTEHQWHYGHLL